MRRLLAALPLAVLALAACGGSDDDAAGDADTGSTVTSGSESTTPSSGPPSSPPTTISSPTSPRRSAVPVPSVSAPPGTPIDPTTPLVVAAVENLAGRLDIDPADVTVVDARAVTWPDGSLGCPEPGMMYTQALVEGTFVLLAAGGQRYEYHGGTPLFLCEPGKGPARDG